MLKILFDLISVLARSPRFRSRRSLTHLRRDPSFLAEVLEHRKMLTGGGTPVTVTGGTAILTLDEGKAAAIDELNAYFDQSASRAQTLSNPAPGNAAFNRLDASTVQLSDPVRPFGVVPTPYPGVPGATRSPQMTTLSLEDTSDILGSWSASSDSFAFVGSSVKGEQIAFENMQRWTGPFTGSLVYGDFGLRYVPSRAVGDLSGFVLTSNIDFLDAAWADLANVHLSITGNQLLISGDLRISGALTVLDSSAVLGEHFGTFALTATLSSSEPVPEPDIQMVSATSDGGTTLTVTYNVLSAPVGAFDLGVYRSTDAAFGGDTLLATLQLSAADGTVGLHTKTFTIGTGMGQVALPGAGSADIESDYHLLVVADPEDEIAESDPNNNVAGFAGVYHAAGGIVQIHGSAAADVVTITAAPSVTYNGTTYSYALADVSEVRVRAHGGNDVVNASTLTKLLTVWGGDGNDTLTGGTAADVLEGGSGNDVLSGGVGDDTYNFDADSALGSDTISDAAGVDTLDFSLTTTVAAALNLGLTTSQSVNPNLTLTLASATAFENIVGTAKNDSLTGNALANTLTGGAGNDTLSGGLGDDRYRFDADAALGSDVLSDSGGIDMLDYGSTTTLGISLNLATAGAQILNPNLTLTLGSATAFENVIGTAQNDTLTGNILANTITGSGGNDTIMGGSGNDTYVFDADSALGSDVISDSAGIDTIDLSGTTTVGANVNLGLTTPQLVNPNLTLTLGSAAAFENIIGTAKNDTLSGNTLVNLLTGGAGNDTLDGAGGNDSYLFAADSPLGIDTISDSAGIDTLDFSATTSLGAIINLGLTTAQVVNGNLSVTLNSATAIENVIGTAQDDTLIGNTLANTLTGGAGNDTIDGGAGNDIYLLDADSPLGSDTILDSIGTDTLSFSATTTLGVTVDLGLSTAQVVNVNLTLNLVSETASETIIGSAQDDTLTGNTLANTLTGGAGNDILAGGTGNDIYLFDTDSALGSDTVVDSAGVDTLNFGATTTQSITVDLSVPTPQIVNSNLILAVGNSIENVTGGLLADVLTGNSLSNLLTGGAGNDTLYGLDGNDILSGGAGDDVLSGGIGNDAYSFDADTALGSDSIAELPGAGVDTLDFATTTTQALTVNLSNATAQVVHANLTLTLGAVDTLENVTGGSLNDVLTGNGLPNTLNGGAGNDTLNGNEGNDFVIGGIGNDLLVGASGDDTYSFDADTAIGSDTLIDSSGIDLIDFSQTTLQSISIDLSNTAAQVVNSFLSVTLSSATSFEMVIGGAKNDTIVGNELKNFIVGGSGNDSISGLGGRDIIVGGSGIDSVIGGGDDDVIISGKLSYYDETTKVLNRGAVDSLAAEWARGDLDYASRIANLRNGGGLNGTFKLDAATVITDGSSIDTLTGGLELDWFWKFGSDLVTDLNTGGTETVN